MGGKTKVYKVLIGKPEGKGQLRISGCRWKDVRMGLKKNWWVWTGLIRIISRGRLL
jgi:hypothetical protein